MAGHWLLIASITSLAGCKSSTSPERKPIETHRAEGATQLSRLKQVHSLVLSQPPLDADTASFRFANADFRRYEVHSVATGSFVAVDDLTDQNLKRGTSDAPFSLYQPFVEECGGWFSADDMREPIFDAPTVARKVKAFLAVKWLGVIRTNELNEEEGHHRFEVLFYQLSDPPSYAGGLRLDVRDDARGGSGMGRIRQLSWEALFDAVSSRTSGLKLDPRDAFAPLK